MLLIPSLPSSEQMKCTSVSLCLPVTSQPSPALYTCEQYHQAIRSVRKVKAALCCYMLALQQDVVRPGYSGQDRSRMQSTAIRQQGCSCRPALQILRPLLSLCHCPQLYPHQSPAHYILLGCTLMQSCHHPVIQPLPECCGLFAGRHLFHLMSCHDVRHALCCN